MNEKFPDGIQQLEEYLNTSTDNMHNSQKTGKYVDAENLRLRIQEGRRELERRKLNEMQFRHKREARELDKAHQDELIQFNQFWEKKIKDFNDEAKKAQDDLLRKHSQELNATKDQLDKTIPIKYKQSSQLLNLKKMEEHMAKQKNYAQAHKVQAKINILDKQENDAWLNMRSIKIQTCLNQLRAKQANELAALRKRIFTNSDEQNKDRKKQQGRLIQKYNNVKAELFAQHEKQNLFFKGQFRSKVNVSTSGSGSKIKY